MSKAKASVPDKKTVLAILRGVEVPSTWDSGHTTETKRLEAAANKRRDLLLKDATYRDLLRKASRIRNLHKRRNQAKIKKRNNLINRVHLRGVTPAIVSEVEKMLGL